MQWISIDPGLNTGYTIWQDNQPVMVGKIKINGKTYNEQIKSLRGSFSIDIGNTDLACCVIEYPNYWKEKILKQKSKLNIVALGRTIGWIEMFFYQKFTADIIEVPASRHGSKKKKQVQAMILLKYPELRQRNLNEHQLDSVDIGDYWLKKVKFRNLKKQIKK